MNFPLSPSRLEEFAYNNNNCMKMIIAYIFVIGSEFEARLVINYLHGLSIRIIQYSI